VSFTLDVWTDINLRPFLAVTGHWIHVETVQTSSGPQYKLELKAALIGFHHLPGRHTADHLAHSFLHLVDRIKVAEKVCFL
jgi:hypothetical protein